MDINKVLCYLTEELKDIPAKPDNIHYTDFEGLYYILQEGLKGLKGGYDIHSPKTKKDDIELATVRNTHKLTKDEKMGLSSGAAGGVKIELFTDRILAAHRGTRKDKIAELPQQRKIFIQQDAKSFKKKYGYDIPDLTVNEPEHEFNLKKEIKVLDWMDANKHPKDNEAVVDILSYNMSISEYYKELKEREREERFILKKGIPARSKFMRIIIEVDPDDIGYSDREFCMANSTDYLSLLSNIDKRDDDLIVKNKNYFEFKKFLRNIK